MIAKIYYGMSTTSVNSGKGNTLEADVENGNLVIYRFVPGLTKKRIAIFRCWDRVVIE